VAELNALEELTEALDARQSFKLEAGAGSGKTYALVYALHHLLSTQRPELEHSGRAIACITYTNAAKDEIRHRIADDPLVHVSTIHEFLWDAVQRYQSQLREALIQYNHGLKTPIEGVEDLPVGAPISYSDRRPRFAEGVISHDEVIELSYRVISKHRRISKIIADRYPYIFVDEYQDTFPRTVELLLDHVLPGREARIVVGLFGDSMQKIYSSGVGAVISSRLRTITKHENFRSSRAVVTLLNKIRPDLLQYPAGEDYDGETWLFASQNERTPAGRLKLAHDMLAQRGWSIDNTKHLFLTHRLIAGTLGYSDLDRLYDQRGRNGRADLLEGREAYAHLLTEIEALRRSHEAQDLAALTAILHGDNRPITRHAQKRQINTSLRELFQLSHTASIGEVIDRADSLQLIPKSTEIRAIEKLFRSEDLDERDTWRVNFAKRVREVTYREWTNFARFRDEQTPFSTQHGVKGAEFDDVLVAIDDTAWTQYSMGKMIAGTDKPDRATRSRNMFYVCCSRARRRLAVVFLSELPDQALPVVRDWFGTECIVR
jgi:DNA helicase II / ATP-dependent DNA helicase PcrA